MMMTIPAAVHAASCGDINGNGSKQINDVTILLRSVNNLETDSALCGGLGVVQCGDINASGGKDIGDVVGLLRNVSNIETLFPICVGPGPNLAGCPGTATVPATVSSNLTIPAGCDCRINGTTFVQPGVVMTFQAGAVCKGTKGSATPSVLVFQPDSKIDARGTSVSPVVFTSDQTPGSRNKGDWGGVVILGRAPVNTPGGTDTIEGLPPTADLVFGGNESNDSSGVVRFTRVEFSGIELTLDNELNLFVTGGAGRGTTLDHIQGHNGLDDCIEWFGGTVNAKFLVASACGDDGFDTQLGTSGAVQYGLIAQERDTVEAGGSNGWESDNNENGFDLQPRTSHRYCNVTALGVKGQGEPSATNQVGMLARRGTAITVANAIIKGFRDSGVQIRDGASAARACVNSSTLATAAPVLGLQNAILYDNGPGTPGTAHFKNHSTCDTPGECTCTTTEWGALLQASKNVLTGTDPGVGGGTFPPTNLVPTLGSIADTHPAVNCSTIDPFFDAAQYIGAFEPGGSDWTAGWTAYPLN
jgi:hypothetical protein